MMIVPKDAVLFDESRGAARNDEYGTVSMYFIQ